MLAGSLVLAAALAGCGTSIRPRPALQVPAADFRQQVRTICLTALHSQVAVPDAETRLAQAQAALVTELRSAGYVVVPPEQTAEAWRRAMQREGGVYDPHTGRRDEARDAEVRPRVLHAMGAELGCTAVAYPTIALVTAPFHGDRARWDGVEYRVGGGFEASGWNAALSLWVSITDLDGRELLFCTGGIQPIFSVESSFWGSDFAAASDADILVPGARLVNAITTCLGPILAPSVP